MEGILCIVLIGLTLIVEIYYTLFASVEYLYGAQYFLAMLLMIGMPVITLLYILNMVRLHKARQNVTVPMPEQGAPRVPVVQQYAQQLATLSQRVPSLRTFSERCSYQLTRYQKKKAAVATLLNSEKATLNREKCRSILQTTEDIFMGRIATLLRSAELFDETEYELFQRKALDLEGDDAQNRKQGFYDNLFGDMEEILDNNETILLRLDELAATINRQHAGENWDMETKISLYKLDQTISHQNEALAEDKAATNAAVDMWANMNGIS